MNEERKEIPDFLKKVFRGDAKLAEINGLRSDKDKKQTLFIFKLSVVLGLVVKFLSAHYSWASSFMTVPEKLTDIFVLFPLTLANNLLAKLGMVFILPFFVVGTKSNEIFLLISDVVFTMLVFLFIFITIFFRFKQLTKVKVL